MAGLTSSYDICYYSCFYLLGNSAVVTPSSAFSVNTVEGNVKLVFLCFFQIMASAKINRSPSIMMMVFWFEGGGGCYVSLE